MEEYSVDKFLDNLNNQGHVWKFRNPAEYSKNIDRNSERIEKLEQQVKVLEKKVRDLDGVKKAVEAGEK